MTRVFLDEVDRDCLGLCDSVVRCRRTRQWSPSATTDGKNRLGHEPEMDFVLGLVDLATISLRHRLPSVS